MNETESVFPWYGFLGLLIVGVGEVLLFVRFWLVPVYFTPLVWSGYILFVDALNYRVWGQSLIRTRPREFLIMVPWSIACWLIFELYNIHMQNWIYNGLPQNLLARTFGYAWSFATIFPAILETADLLQPIFEKFKMKPRRIFQATLRANILFGFLCLFVPLLFSLPTAKYFMAFVWLGFAFLLEPINYLLGGRSLFRYFETGELKQLFSLIFSGLLCGLLWEFWNYWAEARWVYDIPYAWAGPKIFEMPLLGFLGFIPFAVETHSMQNYLLVLLSRKKVIVPSLTSS